ncbi:tRNA (adenosine(37)-N6)-threonylcarbamoyltransferase complex dimerization subunit type 1 TsaB [Mucisphaera calidilacus]|uniref:tRNA threonylcarbamoyladenosine biosynthesis protein TsaB n=1 Tax=Mucisphaera calidilacus TaxID=2527982 RepID=A0A518C1C8_9BACT|nr:tRNA (adenosine(37)-N6)-threonylcarbamoyltransferase complex dimerization subunit type 1 TsaB [Mucisphaera calidilacus]QDU73020.1 tRNA threonylcarbamoyladenosine biosynthesis protein TsaB [Mucisphaera calidilacus]
MNADDPGLLLAIETSGRTASIAIGTDEQPLLVRSFEPARRHSVGLVPQLADAFHELSLNPGQLNTIALSTGPGSFTGLRVGFAVTQTLTLTTPARVVAIPTTHTLAHNAPPDARHIAVALNTKADNAWIAAYQRTGHTLTPTRQPHAGLLAELLANPQPDCLIAQTLPETITRNARDLGINLLLDQHATCSAAVVYQLGRAAAHAGDYSDPSALTPTYGRQPEAVSLWQQRKNP